MEETFNLNLTNAIHASFSDNQGLGTITDDDGTNNKVTIANATPVWEGETAQFAVSRLNTTQTTAFRYMTVDGTAKASTTALAKDYTGTQGSQIPVTFPSDVATVTISVSTIDDTIFGEKTEYFGVQLTTVTTGGSLGSPKVGVGTIWDNDALVLVSNPPSTPEGELDGIQSLSLPTGPHDCHRPLRHDGRRRSEAARHCAGRLHE